MREIKLWGMNSLKMQGDILRGGAAAGFKEGTPEMARYERMMWANMFMFGLALMFPHTIFESQLPQPIDAFAQLSGVFFGDDEKNKRKRKNLFSGKEDLWRDILAMPMKMPLVNFPAARVPLALYDLPATFRAIYSHDVHDMATATTLNLMPFGRMTKDVYNAYQNPAMASELLAGIPLHRMENFHTKSKKARMLENILNEEKAKIEPEQDEVAEMMRTR